MKLKQQAVSLKLSAMKIKQSTMQTKSFCVIQARKDRSLNSFSLLSVVFLRGSTEENEKPVSRKRDKL